jgi:hypothetical protein
MSYAIQGNSCHPQTIAFTNNHKYMPPMSPIYDLPTTFMSVYPNTSSVISLSLKDTEFHHHPEHIKHFYSRETDPTEDRSDTLIKRSSPFTGEMDAYLNSPEIQHNLLENNNNRNNNRNRINPRLSVSGKDKDSQNKSKTCSGC